MELDDEIAEVVRIARGRRRQRVRALHGADDGAVERGVARRLLETDAGDAAVGPDLEPHLRDESRADGGVRPDALHGLHDALLVGEELEADDLPAAASA